MRRNPKRDDERADGGSAIVVTEQPDESTTHAILRGVSELKGVDETDLDPLYHSIEVESMERLMEHSRDHGSEIAVTFPFEDCTVRVHTDERIEIQRDTPRLG